MVAVALLTLELAVRQLEDQLLAAVGCHLSCLVATLPGLDLILKSVSNSPVDLLLADDESAEESVVLKTKSF